LGDGSYVDRYSPVDVLAGAPFSAGDVDCSGTVDSIDALLVLQHIVYLSVSLGCPQNADVNHDGLANGGDAMVILQFSARLLDHLPG
jgi:hypothetical protein